MIYIIPTDTCFGISCSITEYKDYEKIYKIKKRDYKKPLVILVPNFEWLEKYTDITKEQVNFLKNYEKPWTILTKSNFVKIWLNFVNEETQQEFGNRAVYEKIAFRVANTYLQKKLLKKEGPLFLTSANISSEGEIYSVKEIKENFGEYINKGIIRFLGEEFGDLKKTSPSEIFEFDGNSIKQIFIRK